MTTDAPIIPPGKVLPPMRAKTIKSDSTKRKRGTKCTRDRFTVLNTFVDFSLAGIHLTDAAVWLVLYRDTQDGIARTGQSDIARRAGIGRRTVTRSVKRLEDRGLLTVVYRGGLNRGMSAYRVHPLAGAEP